ncbi:hypothetical protein [Phocaeicola vulgatus]|jgi:hypothetical protein|uniref:hypothetical protein n=1 Tax=Phocaeicola vulgatus TaxID=821 RepID=UPI00189F3DAB|nr:hypothetical protein [Phocaeicola vulgatus]
MGFTTQCFIRKNTANIRNRLKELGYYCNPYLGWHNLFTCVFGVNSVYSLDDYDTNGLKEIDGLIDCGTNEELFLAIAALRDDTDNNQLFTNGKGDWGIYRDGSDGGLSGMDFYGMPNDFNLSYYHKATVNELIEHFKTKEEQ